MSHCTLVAHKFVSAIFGRSRALITNYTGDGTCCGGVGNALAVVACTLHLLRWREYGIISTCCVGASSSKTADTNLAAE